MMQYDIKLITNYWYNKFNDKIDNNKWTSEVFGVTSLNG